MHGCWCGKVVTMLLVNIILICLEANLVSDDVPKTTENNLFGDYINLA